MSDAELQQRLADTRFVVDATSNEIQMLWEKFSDEATNRSALNIYRWRQMNTGMLLQLGTLADMPVCMSVCWNRINGILVMFVEGVSRVVDHRMIDLWLAENCCPRWEQGHRIARCDAANFHHVLNYIKHPDQR